MDQYLILRLARHLPACLPRLSASRLPWLSSSSLARPTAKETHDYLGRTYLSIPTPADILLPTSAERLDKPRTLDDGIESFVPKKCIHTWSGHTKGVSRIRLFPTSGHMVLSASLDTRIKLWDIYREGKCLRTFMGHSKAVHDVEFNNSGGEFLSAAFDRQMKLWDTETGAFIPFPAPL
ncbi:hypothetical protein JCM11641_000192, partial [Rhodosporidiobolus odoratus]